MFFEVEKFNFLFLSKKRLIRSVGIAKDKEKQEKSRLKAFLLGSAE